MTIEKERDSSDILENCSNRSTGTKVIRQMQLINSEKKAFCMNESYRRFSFPEKSAFLRKAFLRAFS